MMNRGRNLRRGSVFLLETLLPLGGHRGMRPLEDAQWYERDGCVACRTTSSFRLPRLDHRPPLDRGLAARRIGVVRPADHAAGFSVNSRYRRTRGRLTSGIRKRPTDENRRPRTHDGSHCRSAPALRCTRLAKQLTAARLASTGQDIEAVPPAGEEMLPPPGRRVDVVDRRFPVENEAGRS